MVLLDSRLHDLSMENARKRPLAEKRVQINCFLGVFEVIQIGQNGLDVPGPDYVETEIVSQELIYLESPQFLTPSKRLPAQRSR
jgi:hypothetical protein